MMRPVSPALYCCSTPVPVPVPNTTSTLYAPTPQLSDAPGRPVYLAWPEISDPWRWASLPSLFRAIYFRVGDDAPTSRQLSSHDYLDQIGAHVPDQTVEAAKYLLDKLHMAMRP